MATPTMIPLANLTLGSNQSTVTFSNISQNYRDLVLVITARTTLAANNESLITQINGDSTNANYTGVRMLGSGSAASSDATAGAGGGFDTGYMPAASSTSGVFGQVNLNFLDYSTNDKHKTILNRWNTAGSGTPYAAGTVVRWASTAPITSLKLFGGSGGNLLAGSTFELFGVIA